MTILGKLDPKEELARKVRTLVRDLHFELVTHSGVKESALLPVDEIKVETTMDGVQIRMLAPKNPVVRRTFDPDSDAE